MYSKSYFFFEISNAVGRSGTFCAIFNVLEKLKLEKVVDVFQTVKLLRIQRPGAVEDLVSPHIKMLDSYFTLSFIVGFNV